MFIIIEKLLSFLWKDFKNKLKYKRKQMQVKDLISRLRLKEDGKLFKEKQAPPQ